MVFDAQNEELLDTLLLSSAFEDYSSAVSCLSVRADQKYLCVGYKCGAITIYGLLEKNVKVVADPDGQTCLSCKIVKNNNETTVFASSASRKVTKYFQKISFFGLFDFEYEAKVIFEEEEPVFQISEIEFDKLVNEGASPNKTLLSKTIICFSSAEKVRVCTFEPMSELFVLDKPKQCWNKDTPFFTCGLVSLEERDVSSSNLRSSIATKLKSNIFEQSEKVFICVSWGATVSFYCIDYGEEDIIFSPMGTLLHEEAVLAVTFIFKGVFCILDAAKRLFLIYPETLNRTKREKLNPCIEVAEYITMNAFESRFGVNMFYCANSVSYAYKRFVLLGNKNILVYEYLKWNECADFLKQKLDFAQAIALLIGIFEGKVNDLAGIPPAEAERRDQTSAKIKMLLIEAVMRENHPDIETDLKMAIETCISIKEFNFLFMDVLSFMSKKRKKETFFSVLEPYVLSDSFKDYSMTPDLTSFVLGYYCDTHQAVKYNLIVDNFYHSSIYESFVSSVCREKQLIRPLLYIAAHSTDRSKYLDNLHFLIKTFVDLPSKHNLTSYPVALKENDLKTKEYFLIQLIHSLDYITNEVIRVDIFQDVLCFFLCREYFSSLVKFSPSLYFQILLLLIRNEKVAYTLEMKASPAPKCMFYSKMKYNCEYLTVSSIRDIVISHFLEDDRETVLLQMYYFLLTIYSKAPCSLEILCNGIKALLAQEDQVIDNTSAEAQETSLSHLDSLLKTALKRNKMHLVGTQVTKEFLSLSMNSNLDKFTFYLLKKEKRYIELVKFVLRTDTRLKIKPFDWVQKIIDKTQKKKDFEAKADLENFLVRNIDKLARLNFADCIILVEKNLGDRKLEVIRQLDEFPEIQLNFVEKYITKIESNDNERFSRASYSNSEVEWLFKVHIELLCRLNPERVVTQLEVNKSYDQEVTLNVCKEYKNYDAILYILIHSHRNGEAIDLCIEVMNRELRTFTNNVLFDRPNDANSHEEFTKMTSFGIKICEQTSALNESEGVELWMQLCDFLVNISNELSRSSTGNRSDEINRFKETVSDSISRVLNGMSLCIKVDAVVEVTV